MWNIIGNWIKRSQKKKQIDLLASAEVGRKNSEFIISKKMMKHFQGCHAQGLNNFYVWEADDCIHNLLAVKKLFDLDPTKRTEACQLPERDFLMEMARSRELRAKLINAALPILETRTEAPCELITSADFALERLRVKAHFKNDPEYCHATISWAYVINKITGQPPEDILIFR